ncbi:unnamed protein product [Dracunculus medinensis]|uniref:Uncharacterized protein n=1 Tax=Dracunculus medinensis TaxID=318479 RepID=A0A0N4UCP3_DRAME|nr:unnamed protein product [Dracunculus medinensis]
MQNWFSEYVDGCINHLINLTKPGKDKDEVGKIKEEINLVQLLEGCPREILDFAAHLKALTYSDEPNYDLLETILNNIIMKYNISFDEPYDWENGYEKIGGKARVNGEPIAKNRSHTTAIKDRLPEEKNKALDTQAPITMGEDDDEQTGAHGKWQVITHDKEQQDKPKYKRQEFMRPKYGPVNFDIIDAVNARLAAASRSSTDNLDANNANNTGKTKKNGDVEATFELPATLLKPLSNEQHINAQQCSTIGVCAIRQKNNNDRNSKGNRSVVIDLSNGKRNNKKLNIVPVDGSSYAQADDEGVVSSHLKAPTITSKWHASFDESCEDGEAIVEGIHGDKSENSISPKKPENRFAGVRPFRNIFFPCFPLL